MLTDISSKQPRSVDEWIAIIATASFAYFVGAVLVLQVLRTDYDPLAVAISSYAVGPFGAVMTSAFIALSTGSLALFVGFVGLGPKTVFFRVSLILLAIFVPGIFVAALFPTDMPNAPVTTHGLIHNYDAAINFISIIAAIVLFSIGFGSDPRWRSFRRTALTMAATVVSSFVVMILTFNSPYAAHFAGLANKALAATMLVWLIAASLKLKSIAQAVAATGRMDRLAG